MLRQEGLPEEWLKKAGTLLAGQSRVFELLANGAPQSQVLEKLIEVIESLSIGMRASVLLLSEDGKHLRHGAAPHLPEEYNKAVDGFSIGPFAASCGTASFRREPVIVTDTLSDPLWAGYRNWATQFSLRACWSTPIFSSDGALLGKFAMYYQESRTPTPFELQMIQDASHKVCPVKR